VQFIGDEKTARSVLAKVTETKAARDQEGHPLDVFLREENVVILGFPEIILEENETRATSLAPGMPFEGRFLCILPETGAVDVCAMLAQGQEVKGWDWRKPVTITLNNKGHGQRTVRVAIFGRRAHNSPRRIQ
jgi:hypothetical protein